MLSALQSLFSLAYVIWRATTLLFRVQRDLGTSSIFTIELSHHQMARMLVQPSFGTPHLAKVYLHQPDVQLFLAIASKNPLKKYC
jgi:hypothetical protein